MDPAKHSLVWIPDSSPTTPPPPRPPMQTHTHLYEEKNKLGHPTCEHKNKMVDLIFVLYTPQQAHDINPHCSSFMLLGE